MGSLDQGDDQTYKVDFTDEGAAGLRETVKEKLKEFMGDYTDDTLAEYVVVLLRNGKSRGEARNELDVFLGDDSDPFVSWLWDHLSTSLDLYVQPEEADALDVTEPNLLPDDRRKLDSGIENGKSDKLLRSQHNRECNGLARDTADPPPLLSSEIEKIDSEEKPRRIASRVERPVSPQHESWRKRSRSNDRHQVQDAGRQAIDAPRRLLQFAVRDAVVRSRPDSTKESAFKRLRYVVSTSSEDLPLIDCRPKIRSVATVPNPMATVIKAVDDNIRKVKPSKSVFDRLGRGEEASERGEAVFEYKEYGSVSRFPDETRSAYLERYRQVDGDMKTMESDPFLASYYVSDYGMYEEVDARARKDVFHSDAFGGEDDDLMMDNYNVANNGEDSLRFRWSEERDEPPVTTDTYKATHRPESFDTREPRPHYHVPKKVSAPHEKKPLQQKAAVVSTSDEPVMQEKRFAVSASSGNVKSVAESQRIQQQSVKSVPEPQRIQQQSVNGLSAGSMDDADSRTIFVNNVHVGATEDSLSQHFNHFGKVLKVIINTDSTTGQPVGSATIEFAQQESADNALSLNGISFMSRILKVMKRNPSALRNPAPSIPTAWPQSIRGSPYGRFPRDPFPRATFRARMPTRAGPRSMQWKREAQPNSSDPSSSASSTSSFTATPPFTARKFTYVRPEAKPEGNVGAKAT